MINKIDKNSARKQRAKRQASIHGTAKKPRLSVFRSLNHIYVQAINDDKGVTICAANTLQPDLAKAIEKLNKEEQAFKVGEALGKILIEKKIKEAVFDRNGYLYTGRIQKVADGVRSVGVKF
ncbi:MAG: 50S ribosomal protein L18 [Christensenellaceae bacterium]|jgi:large subunit ribosomal protein L18|nr:50S ribosomal protein L18 [Christensenellaceae bacterium]